MIAPGFCCFGKMVLKRSLLCVQLQDGHVQQAGAVAAACRELWSQYGPAGSAAGLGTPAALPHLQSLLQTGWASQNQHQQVKERHIEKMFLVLQLFYYFVPLVSHLFTQLDSFQSYHGTKRLLNISDFDSWFVLLVLFSQCIYIEAYSLSSDWDVRTLPFLWAAHVVGAAAQRALLPRSASRETLQQQRCFPLSYDPHLPPHWVSKVRQEISPKIDKGVKWYAILGAIFSHSLSYSLWYVIYKEIST